MNVAFIPVRSGSKSIPQKNIKPMNGKPLVYWTVKAACSCKYIDEVYVSTDGEEIRQAVNEFMDGDNSELFTKVKVIGRSEESASDIASTELAMLEYANNYTFDNIVLIQATSPLLTCNDLDKGFELFSDPETDSVLSVVNQKRFIWKTDESGFMQSANYNIYARPRRQDFDGYFIENGAFYITSKQSLLKSGNRLSGNIKAVEMDANSFLEIDEPSDWIIIESIMKKNGHFSDNMSMPEIKMFLTDCDGCLTDGGMYYSESGDELKKFNTKDGMGFSLLKEHGIITGIVTGEDRELNRCRAKKLNLDIIESGCKDKVAAVHKLCSKYNISFENVAYVGDDINDIELLIKVGFSSCPNDAVAEVKNVVKYQSKINGGNGVIRDVIDKILVLPSTSNHAK